MRIIYAIVIDVTGGLTTPIVASAFAGVLRAGTVVMILLSL